MLLLEIWLKPASPSMPPFHSSFAKILDLLKKKIKKNIATCIKKIYGFNIMEVQHALFHRSRISVVSRQTESNT